MSQALLRLSLVLCEDQLPDSPTQCYPGDKVPLQGIHASGFTERDPSICLAAHFQGKPDDYGSDALSKPSVKFVCADVAGYGSCTC
jgi:hypothetical protein